MQNTSSALLK